ncbi:MAG: DUF4249 family protein [Bacteroidetes bacterium]|nr:DUF4249 family protein [Bacteroidota bacterium]
MKKYTIHFLLLLTLALAVSCEDDIDLNADYKNITIVYGLLDPVADTNFIRVNKAFLGGDAYANILIPDCTQYSQELDVRITAFLGNSQQGDPIVFSRMNRYIYYSLAPLNDDFRYKLEIDVEGNKITSETGIVVSFGMSKPPRASWTPPQFSTEVNYRRGFNQEIVWDIEDNAQKYEAQIEFVFNEVLTDNTVRPRSIIWLTATRNLQPGYEMTVTYSNDLFYTVIQNTTIYNDPAEEDKVVKRVPHRVIYSVSAAAPDLATYIDANQPIQTVVEYRPDYTNVVNGYGIFSSRTRDTLHKYLHRDTRKNLSELPGTKFEFIPQ